MQRRDRRDQISDRAQPYVVVYARSVVPDDPATDVGEDGDQAAGPGALLRVHKALSIPMSEITWRATTSGGPGGQHANRTLSRVEVQFDVAGSTSLGPRQRARLLERYGPTVRAASSESRSQSRNRQVALERLAVKVAEGLRVDRTRHPTKPTRGSKIRRVEEKRQRAETKRRRRTPNEHDE
jgi:ribosome-associated protein